MIHLTFFASARQLKSQFIIAKSRSHLSHLIIDHTESEMKPIIGRLLCYPYQGLVMNPKLTFICFRN